MAEQRHPFMLPHFRPGEQLSARKLNEAAAASRRREGGESPPRQSPDEFIPPTGAILVTCATWGNFDFNSDPQSTRTDGVSMGGSVSSPIRKRLLAWLQDDTQQNGVYEYFNRGSSEKTPWRKLYDLKPDAIRGRTIRALWGRRFGGLSWACVGENIVQPLFPPRFRVDHGSDYAGEIPAGLTEMGSGYVPAAGDIVYLSDQSEEGIYIAASDDWIQIGQPAPRTPDLSDLDGIGYFDSDLYAVLSKETAEAKGCLWVRHQAAVSPSALATEEPA